MGLVLKESHRSWGFPIGVNMQHTSSMSLFSQHRWVLEALGWKELIWECSICACSCVDGPYYLKNSSVTFFPLVDHTCCCPGESCQLWFGFGFKLDLGSLSYGKVPFFFQAASWGFIVVPFLPSWWVVFKLFENDDPMEWSPALARGRGWRLCSEGLSNAWGSTVWTVLRQCLLCCLFRLQSSGLVAVGGRRRQRTLVYAVTVLEELW